MTLNFAAAATILKAVDADAHDHYKAVYEYVHRKVSGLANIYNKASAWLSMVIITNMTVDPHRDLGDKLDGWVLTQTLGDWRQGQGLVVCPDIGMKFDQRSGDLLLLRSALLEHWVTPWVNGHRQSVVFWTHAGMFTWSGILSDAEEMDVVGDDLAGVPRRLRASHVGSEPEDDDESRVKKRPLGKPGSTGTVPSGRAAIQRPTVAQDSDSELTELDDSDFDLLERIDV